MNIMENLLKLQGLEFGETRGSDAAAQITQLRSKIPPTILAHYDRLAARGKKGIAIVQNQVCSGCHMRLPIGTMNTLSHAGDIELCESCGRYLYLPPVQAVPPPARAPATRRTARAVLR